MRCYVLAGGGSHRMGAPKETLQLGAKTLLQRVTSAAADAFDEVVTVLRTPSSISTWRTVVDDPHGEAAAIFGLHRALRDAEEHGESRAWILAVDYPLMSTELLAHFRSLFESGDMELLVPVSNGHPQMLCAGYAVGLRPQIESRIATGEFALRGMAAQCRTQFLSEDAISARFGPDCLRSVNTPEEFQELRKRYEEAHASG
jgi:molybdopterin-guanine dinucleotide biosynthesis protein A